MDILHLLLLFGVGAVAGFINVNAGGGSSLTLPTLIFLGLDAAVANGTNRIGLILQNIFAVSSFRKNRVYKFKTSIFLAVFTLPGAIIGALIATQVSNTLFQRILGGVLILIVFSMIFGLSFLIFGASWLCCSELDVPSLYVENSRPYGFVDA